MSIKAIIILAVLAAIVLLCVACATRFHKNESKPIVTFPEVDVNEFMMLLSDPDIQVLDVRTRDEFDEGHIAGAILVDVNESDFVDRAVAVLDKQRPVAVYCRSGRRSSRACNLLLEQGYNVTNLMGGVMAWRDAGKALVQ